MLSFKSINKSYSSGFLRRSKTIALSNINFEVRRNEVFGIIGLNGAGKSSILKILMGFIRPDSGEVAIAGKPPYITANRELIGYLPEHPSLYPNLTISEHLRFCCQILGISSVESSRRIKRIVEVVGLSESANTPIKRFSKGMTQRAALGYAILLDPEILILDEPMSGLDPLGRKMVVDIIQDYKKRGATILFCSHILTDTERICDRIGIMHKGQMATIVSFPFVTEKQCDRTPITHDQTPLETLFLKTVQS